MNSSNFIRQRHLVFIQTIALAAFAICGVTSITAAQAWTHNTVHDFCTKFACKDGAGPTTDLLIDSAGHFYGTTTSGPITAFEILPKAEKGGGLVLRAIHSFEGNDPASSLIVDANGNLYGTLFDDGIIFELVPNGDRAKRKMLTLYQESFDLNPSQAPLTYSGQSTGAPYDGTSPLYGVDLVGANRGNGSIFSLTPNGDTWTFERLYTFCAAENCEDGARPDGQLILDQSGNIYGTTTSGGAKDEGVLFEFSNKGGAWTETILHNFCSKPKCTDGSSPLGGLVMDNSGAIYGTTRGGGTHLHHSAGTIFKLVPNGVQSQFTMLYAFCSQHACRDGLAPYGRLTIDSAGNLYGTTLNGGYLRDSNHRGGGTVFMLSGSSLTTLYRFCGEQDCVDGEYPQAGVVMDSLGNLFGTASEGGRFGDGTVFELSP